MRFIAQSPGQPAGRAFGFGLPELLCSSLNLQCRERPFPSSQGSVMALCLAVKIVSTFQFARPRGGLENVVDGDATQSSGHLSSSVISANSAAFWTEILPCLAQKIAAARRISWLNFSGRLLDAFPCIVGDVNREDSHRVSFRSTGLCPGSEGQPCRGHAGPAENDCIWLSRLFSSSFRPHQPQR